jgi:hypothetical protein
MTVSLNSRLSKNNVNFGSIVYVKSSKVELNLLDSMLKLAKPSGDFSYESKDTLEIKHSDLAMAGCVEPKYSGGENWVVIGTDEDTEKVEQLRQSLATKKNIDKKAIFKSVKELTVNAYDAFKTLTNLKNS